jgi:hypothetical protein
MKKGTISECLGITDKDWDETEALAESMMKKEDLISDALLKSATDIKSEEFGEEFEITHFEKRLLVAAYIIGINHGRSQIINKLEENPASLLALMALGKMRK